MGHDNDIVEGCAKDKDTMAMVEATRSSPAATTLDLSFENVGHHTCRLPRPLIMTSLDRLRN